MKLDELDKQITSSDLEALETFADRIFAKVGIDVEFTRHFLDRVNDERNGKQITASELTRLFKQEYKRWGQPIAQMGPDQEAVMKDLVTDINMPFALRWDKENEELDLIVKTVMRKPDFKTSNKEFPVEGRGLYSMGGKSGLRHRPTIRSRTSSASFLPKPIKKPSLLKRIFSDEFSEEATQKPYVSMYRDRDNRNKMVYDVLDKYGDSAFKSYDEDEAQKYFKDNYKAMREDIKEDSQIWKWNKEDPNNPEVLIQGYGRLMLNQIEDSVVGKLKELTKMAERGDFEQIQSLLDRDVMQIMMKAVVDTKAELQATRKRGGPKSRGINKESILDVIGRSEIEELELKEFTLTDVKDMVKKGWMARPTEKQWKELIKTYNKYKGNVTRKDLLDLGIATLGRKESVKEKKEKTDDLLKGFDPRTERALMMLRAKYPQADNILSALLADVENNEKDSDVADLTQGHNIEKLTKAVDILQKEINLLKGDKKLNVVKETGGVGKIVPGINTTIDVGPDEIKKQTAKFGNAVDKDGVPKKNLR